MAMNKQRRTSNINNIVVYDALGNVILPASLTVKGFTAAGFVKTDVNGLLSVDTGAYLPFPSQSGNSGKYLTTDGSILSWGTVSTANIYNSNGTLTGDRTVTSGGYNLTFTGSNTASSAIARGLNLTHTLVAAANNDVLVGLDINPTYTLGAFTGVKRYGIRLASNAAIYQGTGTGFDTPINAFQNSEFVSSSSDPSTEGQQIRISITGTAKGVRFGRNTSYYYLQGVENSVTSNVPFSINATGGNVIIGGTTDAGYKLDVQGTARVTLPLQLDSKSIKIGNTTAGYWFAGSALWLGSFGCDQTTGNVSPYDQNSNKVIIGNTSWATNVNGNIISVGMNQTGSITTYGGILIGNNSALHNSGYRHDLNIVIGHSSGIGFTSLNNTGKNIIIGNSSQTTSQPNANRLTIIGNDIDSDLVNAVVLGDTSQSIIIGAYAGLNASAKLQIDSTIQGFLQPRMTTTQRDAIASPVAGLQVYNTTTNANNYYDGTAWVAVGSNIYTADGTLSGNRVVTMGSNTLTFEKDVIVNGLRIGKGLGQIGTNVSLGSNFSASTTGTHNYSFGLGNLSALTTGSRNTAIGVAINASLTTGWDNIGIGFQPLGANTGQNNLAIGNEALLFKVSGDRNIALGTNAARTIANGSTSVTSASTSIFIGVNTKALGDGQSNQIVIGDSETGLGSNTTIIGNSSTITTALRGRLLLGTTTDTGLYQLDCQGTGRFTGTINANAPTGISINNTANTNVSRIQIPGGSSLIIANTYTSAQTSPSNTFAVGSDGLVIGQGQGHIAIGASTQVGHPTIGWSGNIAMGNNANATNLYSISIGQNSTSGYKALSIGQNAIGASHVNSLVIGHDMTTTGNFQILLGGGDWTNELYLGAGVTKSMTGGEAAYKKFTIQPTGGSGTDDSGWPFTIAGSKGTGAGTPGDVIISTATPTTSGTTLQTLTQRMWVKGDTGYVGIGASPLYRLDVAGPVRSYTDATYNGENGALIASNATNTDKRVFIGYDGTIDAGFIQPVHSGFAYKDIAINAAGGNVLIGTITNSGQKLQVTTSTGDSHLLVWGTTAPSIRLDNASSAATQRFAIGLATATNNFIQGATAGSVCITTASASPIVFGMWQTVSASEVMRITTSKNLLLGLTSDSGKRLQVAGDVSIDSGNATSLEIYNTSTNYHLLLGNSGSASSYGIKYSGNDLTIAKSTGTANITLKSTSGDVEFGNTIKTAAPTGGTAQPWKLGQYNATAPSATGYVELEVNGVLYKLLAST